MNAKLHGSVLDSYTGLWWCRAALHLLEDRNVHVKPDGSRVCRPCQATAQRNRRRGRRKP